MLTNKHVTLYVSGSIAAYKSAVLARLLIKAGADVRVVMTAAAQQIISTLTFETLTKHAVLTDVFQPAVPGQVAHIEWADWTDLAVVAPASADLLAKMASGIADDAASLTLLATTAPIVVVPAMNEHMLMAPATQRNLTQLRQDGVQIIDPVQGFLAEGYQGQGRFPEPEAIMSQLETRSSADTPQSLAGKRILVTAGGTRERIDPVRFITNDSSGKMGYAVAEAAQKAGATVTLISAPSKLTPPAKMTVIPVQSTEDLAAAVMREFPKNDALVMAAAVADFKPMVQADQKIKKTADNDIMTIQLEKTPDILQSVAAIKRPDQVTVGFAAETQHLIDNATQKLQKKALDLLAANDVSRQDVGFNSDNNQVTFLQPHVAPETTQIASKGTIATELVARLATLLKQKTSK